VIDDSAQTCGPHPGPHPSTGLMFPSAARNLEVRYKCTNIMHPGYILYNHVVIIIEPVGYSYKSSYVSLSMHLGYMWGGCIYYLYGSVHMCGDLLYCLYGSVYVCELEYVDSRYWG
jgi:hypothetical protein